MKCARKIAFLAAIGNLLDGWDSGDIAGALLYITPNFHLEKKPNLVGFLVSAGLVGSILSTIFAGPGADWLGRRIMFCISSVIYVVSALIMTFSRGLGMLIVGRVLAGFGVGLIITVVPIYIAEVAPANIRGQLATLPQLTGASGLLFSYVIVFLFSLTQNPSYQIILGNQIVPGLVYLSIAFFYLPESPTWLVRKGRMTEAKQVLQHLLDKDDVMDELDVLVEDLEVEINITSEQWFFEAAQISNESTSTTYDVHYILPTCDEHHTCVSESTSDEDSLLSRCSSSSSKLELPSNLLKHDLSTPFLSKSQAYNTINADPKTTIDVPRWSDLVKGGVKHALIVGIGLQILQQLIGITPVLYFVPQIFQQSGAQVLLSKVGVTGPSASILESSAMSFFMVPSIIFSMRLMDCKGRRQLLLTTIPMLFFALLIVIFSIGMLPIGIAQAAGSFVGVTLYACSFVMGFGPIPNILCGEIFPSRVRGLCSSLCQSAYWSSNTLVTYLFPVLLANMGVGGVFGLLAVVAVLSWTFVFLKVPETKGLPLEAICECFAMSSKTAMGMTKAHTESSLYLQ